MTTVPAAGAAPAPVQRSYLCWIAASVVWALGTIGFVAFAAGGTVGTATVIVSAVVVLILAGVVVLFASRMRAGRSWARVTLTVLGVVFVLTNLISAVSGGGTFTVNGQAVDTGAGSTVSLIAAVLTALLLIAALVLQWRPDAAPHFTPPAAPPRTY